MCVQEDAFAPKYKNEGDYVGYRADCEENVNVTREKQAEWECRCRTEAVYSPGVEWIMPFS